MRKPLVGIVIVTYHSAGTIESCLTSVQSITYHHSKTIWYAGGIFNSYFCFTKHKNMNKKVEVLDQQIYETDFITG